ncbi:MAG: L-histidine N(alpha)-methyltransferase [Verrucomicrobia bacterium]|nr:L-histidine N(alpha)-methyltransferase [Verrucomicrobiota bacterium]
MSSSVYSELAPAAATDAKTLAQEFLHGLKQQPKALPCKFFYDECGSQLFDQICELKEYYPTRTEERILRNAIPEIVPLCGPGCLLVELGSGNSSKTRLLLDHLEKPAAYVPIDISHPHLMNAVKRLAQDYPHLEILPVCDDYTASLRLPTPSSEPERTMIFFPGSTIGNFTPDEARAFLQRIASNCRSGDGFLIGVDLVKDRRLLEPAYNDSKGITAAFNLNLLRRANREAGADFRIKQFQHCAVFNETESRIEMHLVSNCSQRVRIAGEEIQFAENEHITTEYSYKYGVETFCQLAATAGWQRVKTWTDPRHWFSVHYLTL